MWSHPSHHQPWFMGKCLILGCRTAILNLPGWQMHDLFSSLVQQHSSWRAVARLAAAARTVYRENRIRAADQPVRGLFPAMQCWVPGLFNTHYYPAWTHELAQLFETNLANKLRHDLVVLFHTAFRTLWSIFVGYSGAKMDLLPTILRVARWSSVYRLPSFVISGLWGKSFGESAGELQCIARVSESPF